MTSSTKPDIVIVQGAWHTPAHYSKVQTLFEQHGFVVHIPIHPSMNGARPPTSSLAEDTTALRNFVTSLAEAGKSIVVIMHSYGGQVGTNALYGLGLQTRRKEGKEGGVTTLIYMGAFVVLEGMSVVDNVIELGKTEEMPLAFTFNDDMTALPNLSTYLVGEAKPSSSASPSYPSAQAIQEYFDTLKIWNAGCLNEPMTCSKAAWREEGVKVCYLGGTEAQCNPLENQKLMVGKLREQGISVDVVDLETGHCPNFTDAEGVVGAVVGWVG